MTEPRPKSAEELRVDIEVTRAELAETADALAAKLDVKAQAKEKVHAVGDKVTSTVTTTAHDVGDKATAAVHTAGSRVAQDRTRSAIVAGVLAAAVTAFVVWRARRH